MEDYTNKYNVRVVERHCGLAQSLGASPAHHQESARRQKTVLSITEIRARKRTLALGCAVLGGYQSAWTAVPLCIVATVPLAPHAITADRSGQLSIPSCQCLAMPAGDS